MNNRGYMLMLDTMACIGMAAAAKRDGHFIDYITSLDYVEANLISIGELLEHEGAKVDWKTNPLLNDIPVDVLHLCYRFSRLDNDIELIDENQEVELGTFLQCVRLLKKEGV